MNIYSPSSSMYVCLLYIFIYGLFNNAVIGLNCTVLNNDQWKLIKNNVKETVLP